MIIKLTESSFYLFVRNLRAARNHRQKYAASESSYRVKTPVLDPNRCASTPCRSLLFNNTALGWQRILRDTARLTQVANRFAVLTGLGSGTSLMRLTGTRSLRAIIPVSEGKRKARRMEKYSSPSLPLE